VNVNLCAVFSRLFLLHTRVLVTLALLISASLSTTYALAQGTYPTKPVRMIVPFPAGGATDILARAVAERLAQRLGQPVIIDNKPGAGANIGAEAAAKSVADGYTILMGSIASHSIGMTYYRNIGYDIRKDFAPISMTAQITNALVIYPGLPVDSVKSLVSLLKANPGKHNCASSGTGGLIHLTCELFKQQAGVNVVHIPYKGTQLFIPDLMNGQVSITLDTLPPHLPHIRAGKLRALAVTTRKRSAILPDVPTVEEAGYPGFESVAVYALLAPAGTPRDIVERLNRETTAILAQPDLRERLGPQGIDVAGSTPEAVQNFIQNEVTKWAKVIRDGNIKPE
jgi:tripartite-type tricarboxylate transporter receptor subunit TctC